MEIVWQVTGAPIRKRTTQACSDCRSRKRRCYHDGGAGVDGSPEQRQAVGSSASGSPGDTRHSSPSPGRVSEYNPESLLEDFSEARKFSPSVKRRASVVSCAATTQRSSNVHEEHSISTAQRLRRQLAWHKKQRRRPSPPHLTEPHRRYLEDVGAFLELPRSTTDALIPVYTSFLNDLIPIMDATRIFHEYSNGNASRYLVKAMCLVTCKARQARPFLRLVEHGPVLSPLSFASSLLAGLDAAMKADLEQDRVTKIQVLALMHLHNDGVAGVDRSSAFLSQAISEAWAMSLHWKIPGNEDQDQCDLLWWSLRNFDRLNKPIMGAAPFIIDDSDVAINRIEPNEKSYRSNVMAVSLKLGDLMVQATRVYKASSKATVDDGDYFLTFEDVTSAVNFEHFHRSHRAYLEIWYHVTAMLSCKFSGPRTVPYDRRLSSADRIVEIISRDGHENFPPLPLVPYGLAMATTVVYRAFRDGQRNSSTTFTSLQRCCDILDAVSRDWTTVKGVAKLARRLCSVLDNPSLPKPHGNSTIEASYTPAQASAELHPASITRAETMPACDNVATTNATPSSNVSTELSSYDARNSHTFLRQADEAWTDVGSSYAKLDTAFNDMFDYGMINVFRDPSTWDFIQTVDDEQRAFPGSSFSPYIGSSDLSPDMSYPQPEGGLKRKNFHEPRSL